MPSFSPAVAGYAIVVTSAVAFACNNAFAVLAFNGGATPLTTVTVRNVIALAALALLLKASRARIALPRRERWIAMGIGILTGGVAFCLMSAFDLIAVGLAVLIFYLYPIITGLGAWAIGQEKLSRGLIAGLVGGFAGLALALEFAGSGSSGPGLALAAAAAIFMATVVLVSARVLEAGNSRAVTVHMHISASAMFIALSLAMGEFALPETARGWTGFLAVSLFYTIAVACFFAAISRIGGVRASLVMNLEPVATIALGFVLLGQILTARQLLGAAVVLAAVTAVKWFGGEKS